MRFIKLQLENFASYKNLDFNYSNLGLCLVRGSTGSGKSTLQDAPAWILYGATAKDGNADDVRSWYASEESTRGVLTLVDRDNKEVTITRIRGRSSENDLYWVEKGDPIIHRGKDITETQKLLERRVGVSKDLYIAGAYYNEFSPTGAFFTAKAKDRRELFEKLADLELPVLLADRITDVKKETRKIIIQITQDFSKTSGRLEQLKINKKAIERDAERWEKDQERSIKELKEKDLNFETEKNNKLLILLQKSKDFDINKETEKLNYINKIAEYETKISSCKHKCSECGQPNIHVMEDKIHLERVKAQLDKLLFKMNPYTNDIIFEENKENPYKFQLFKLALNPFIPQIDRQNMEILSLEKRSLGEKGHLDVLNIKLHALDTLYDLSFKLRGELLLKTIKSVEQDTNRFLESYFDSELRAEFTVKNGDDLDISITKNGYSCTYKQLSKGQRCLLKLTFAASVMKASANRAGIYFSTLFFDESLDGLDSNLKMKAFNLFDELSTKHENVLIVEHSNEMLSLFNNVLNVTLIDNESIIEEI